MGLFYWINKIKRNSDEFLKHCLKLLELQSWWSLCSSAELHVWRDLSFEGEQLLEHLVVGPNCQIWHFRVILLSKEEGQMLCSHQIWGVFLPWNKNDHLIKWQQVKPPHPSQSSAAAQTHYCVRLSQCKAQTVVLFNGNGGNWTLQLCKWIRWKSESKFRITNVLTEEIKG